MNDFLYMYFFACAFQVLAFFSSKQFIKIYDASYFFTSSWYYVLLITLFSLLAVLSIQKDIKIINIFFISIFYGFLSLFIILDIKRNWLPKCFTLTFIIIGIFYQVIEVDGEWWAKAGMPCILFFGLLLFRIYINQRCGGDVFGLGDVYLILGLAVWFSVLIVLEITIIATFIAITFIILKRYHFLSRWCHHNEHPGVPFAPFLCGVTAVWGILPVAIFK